MKKLYRKIAGAVLAAALAVSALPVTASAINVPTQLTVVASPSGARSSSVSISDMSKSQAMNLKSVKTSKKSVAKLVMASQYESSYSSDYADPDTSGYSSSYKDSYVSFLPLKKGTATISFKIGKKTYKTKVTVNAYQNPGSTVKISGVNSGKNVASKANKTDMVKNLKLSKTVSNATVELAAKSGWEICGVSLTNQKTSASRRWTAGQVVRSLKLPVGKLSKSGKYTLSVTYIKSNVTVTVYYLINSSNLVVY